MKDSTEGPAAPPHRPWLARDVACVIVLAILAASLSFQRSHRLLPLLMQEAAFNGWFDADAERVLANMTELSGSHFRTAVHPLFPLLVYPPVRTLRALGLDRTTAVELLLASVGSMWAVTLWLLLRLAGCDRLAAGLFSLLGLFSAAATFWLPVPTPYPFGSLSILLALCAVALPRFRRLSEIHYVLASVLTMSFTVTNWMAGILAALVSLCWRRALQVTVNAFCIVILLSCVQRQIFSRTGLFLIDVGRETRFVLTPEQGGPARVAASLLSHAMVMPEIEPIDRKGSRELPLVSVQRSAPGSGTLWAPAAVALWIGLLALGSVALFTLREQRPLRLALLATLLGQAVLHLLYGEETFLYSLHFLPLLLMVAALGSLTRARSWALALCAALVVSAGLNNAAQFDRAAEVVESHVARRVAARSGPPPSASAMPRDGEPARSESRTGIDPLSGATADARRSRRDTPAVPERSKRSISPPARDEALASALGDHP